MMTSLLLAFIVISKISAVMVNAAPFHCHAFDEDCKQSGNHTCVEACTPNGVVADVGHCYALWRNDSGTVTILHRGCWHTVQPECEQNECVALSPTDDHLFCCCNSNLCNGDIYLRRMPPAAPTTHLTPVTDNYTDAEMNQLFRALLYTFVPILAIVIIIVVVFWLYRRRKLRCEKPSPTNHSLVIDDPAPHIHIMCDVQMVAVKARGRYGAVWKASIADRFVALKVFPAADKESWLCEERTYSLPQMNHENLLHFVSAEVCGKGLQQEFWLLTDYHENGSVSDYLKSNCVSWLELCRIALTMARGLAYLHEEIPARKSVGRKPTIAHRDFKSKNVLLKDDLSACIADFGLAIAFSGNKDLQGVQMQVGTRRYMAPEILADSMVFRRDAFLKVDMYACAMVIWELLSRCSCAAGPVGEHKLPFEDEVGLYPTLEDVQLVVLQRNMRPKIQEHWLFHTGLEKVIDTMEECWDEDADARLSASCVEERLSLLSQSTDSRGCCIDAAQVSYMDEQNMRNTDPLIGGATCV